MTEYTACTTVRATSKNIKIKTESARSYLESYKMYAKMLEMREYEEKLFSLSNQEAKQAAAAYETVCLKTRMREIENFIEELNIDSKWLECKIFLKYHYIHGYTIEECSEKMYISRSTAYRLKKRALRFAAEGFSA